MTKDGKLNNQEEKFQTSTVLISEEGISKESENRDDLKPGNVQTLKLNINVQVKCNEK